MKKINLLIAFMIGVVILNAQNVGIGTTAPTAKLHIKGSADTSQLVIDANTAQSNTRPLIRLRNAAGKDLMWIHTDDTTNSFVGLNAGRMNSAPGNGKWNTFIGVNAGRFNTTGNQNTALGYQALENNVSGYQNTASGYQALFYNQTGNNNTALGYGALYYNVAGSNATAVGMYAMQFATNTATPFTNDNVAVGFSALRGSFFLNTGTQNTAIGYRAMESNSSGFQNTATGYKALHLNSVGKYNTATGGYALYNNSSGDVGGDQNTANGYAALFANTEGKYNTATGYNALYNNNGAFSNTAIGHSAMVNATLGSYNTAVGLAALEYNVGGDYNIAIGASAGNNGANDGHNISIGFNAHIAAGVSRSIVIGDNAFTSISELVLLGNTTTKYCGGYVNWSNFSDGRFKTNVDEEVKGLDFIMRLRPVTYHMNVRALYNLWDISPYGKNESSMTVHGKTEMDDDIRRKEAVRTSGFIAQEVEKAATASGYDFDGVIKPAHDKDHYRLAYAEFVVPLVKAVQEQQKIIEMLNTQLKSMQADIDMLKAIIAVKK